MAAAQRPIEWDSSFGALIAYRENQSDSAVVVLLPAFQDGHSADTAFDATSANGVRVDLFGYAGRVDSAVPLRGFGKAVYEDGCFAFSRGAAGRGDRAWTVALPTGRAKPIPFTLISNLPSADSIGLAGIVVGLSAKIPGADDTAWRSAPFKVDGAGMMKLDSVIVVAASVTRMLPGEEHYAQTYFIIGELGDNSQARAGSWGLVYVHPDRRSGDRDPGISGLANEDEVGIAAALLTVSDSIPVLLLDTRGNEVNGYAAIGRTGPRQWRVVWRGPHEGGC